MTSASKRTWPFFLLAVGLTWGLHIPMFIGQGVPSNLVLVMLLFFTGASLLLTSIHNGSGGSVALAAFAHLGAHLNNSHRALPAEVLPLVVHAVVYAALGFALMRGVLLGGGPRRLVQFVAADASGRR